ncbi:MAG: 1-acyl-sn-glycerol-3-phosphate acyltransferase [Pseudomonadota bacterium]
MHDFDAIRPFRDDEVQGVVARVRRDARVSDAASKLVTPGLANVAPFLARNLARTVISLKSRSIQSIEEFQLLLSHYFSRLIHETISELTVSGVDRLDPARPYLFISNHRDIIMDTGLVNYTVHKAGLPTPEAAVGDNLLTEPLAADLMRLNKSFVIERSVTGKRAIYRALTRTSHYIQHVLKSGDSVWIAQREGRSKDGFDRTDPALLKMLALAWRKEAATFGDFVDHVALVPVSISYELDPCDAMKARELALIERDGHYEKADNEDLTSIIVGMTGFKGRVHVHYGAPMQGAFEDGDALALALDKEIVGGLRVFPTQAAAATRLGFEPVPPTPDWLPEVKASWEARLVSCPEFERTQLLASYGNLIRNRAELGLDGADSRFEDIAIVA